MQKIKSKFSIFKSQFSNPLGFTLIEILVVFAIIGILAAAGFALLNPSLQLQRARDSRRKTDLGKIQGALELYRADKGSYPASPLPVCGSALVESGTTYIKAIPCDPKNTGQYIYTYSASGAQPTSYNLIACLENTNDTQKDATNDVTYCTGTTTNWSYTVTDQ